MTDAVVRVCKNKQIPIIATNHFMPENLTALVPSQKGKKWLEKIMWSGFSHVFNQVSLVTTPTETGARLIRPRLNVEVIAVCAGCQGNRLSFCGYRERA